MHALVRAITASLALAGCTAPGPVTAPDEQPPASQTPVQPPAPEPSPPPAAPIDVAKLSGYVLSREASRDIPPRFTAVVAAIDGASGEGMGTWRLALTDTATNTTHEIKIQAPAAIPLPLRPGDTITARVRPTGGGPNMRHAMVFTADDGPLLAINEPPDNFKVSRGPAGDVDRGPDYVERSYGVTFEHAGVRVSVAAGAWARMTIGEAVYYVWGSGAQRRLRPGKRPMPDYVGAWLDFAIVRVR